MGFLTSRSSAVVQPAALALIVSAHDKLTVDAAGIPASES